VREFVEEIDHFARAEIFLKESFAFGREEIDDALAALRLRDGVEQRGSGLAEIEACGERFFESGGLVVRQRDGFARIPTADADEFGDVIAAIARDDSEGIADFVSEVGAFEGDFDVTSFLRGTRAVEDAIRDETRGEGIGAGEFWFGFGDGSYGKDGSYGGCGGAG
jgi:hypothetical protein